jgi:hypothetical protein
VPEEDGQEGEDGLVAVDDDEDLMEPEREEP